MGIINIYKSIFAFIGGIMLLSVVSCSDNNTELSTTEPENKEEIQKEEIKTLLESAITDWGIQQENVISSMKGYSQVNCTEDNILLFRSPKDKQGISYYFDKGKLCATSIMFPSISTELNIQSLLGGYSFLGELGGGKVYNNTNTNTMAVAWDATEYDSTLCAIGFAPVKSDLYEEATPIIVSTIGNAVTDNCFATIQGRVTGVDKDVEVGIIYGKDANLSEVNGEKASTTSRGDFSVTIKGLIGEKIYYYRPYAMIDDIYYYGDTKTVHSKPITYTIDGKTFKMIKVTGGGLKTFYIMQTELPVNSDLVIGTVTIGKLNRNNSRAINSNRMKFFLDELRQVTGIPFRMPTKEEWQYAARGGQKESNYIYSGSDNIEDVAWYKGNSEKTGHTIAQKSPNALGLYDMSGNYSEMCNDILDPKWYCYVDGPLCGGNWNDVASSCKVNSWINSPTSGKIPGTLDWSEDGAFDTNYITIRLVYSAE